MSGPNPVDDFEAFEVLTLAGVVSPGTCRFPSAPVRDQGWDVQVPSGSSGGWTIHHNMPPLGPFDVEIILWKGEDREGAPVDHFPAWAEFKKIFSTPIKNNQPKALTIIHPLLYGLKPPCTQVVVKAWSEPLPDGKGGATAKITFLEYKPLIIKPVKGLEGSSTAKDDPNAADKEQLDYANYIAGLGGRSLLGSGNDRPTFDEWKAKGKPLQ